MKSLIRTSLITVLIGLCSSTLMGMLHQEMYVMKRPINTMAQGLISVELESSMYADLNLKFSNIAVFNASELVPFHIQRKRDFEETETFSQIQASVDSIKPLSDNNLEVILKVKKEKPLSKLEIKTPIKNYEKTVMLYGSQDQVSWIMLKEASIYDYSKFLNVRKNTVKIVNKTYPYYKVVVKKILETQKSPVSTFVEGKDHRQSFEAYQKTMVEKTFEISGIDLYTSTKIVSWGDQKSTEITLERRGVTKKADPKTTRVSLSTNKQPISSIIVESPTVMFNRSVTIYTDKKKQGTYTFSKRKDNRLELSLSREVRPQILTLEIHNKDNPPLKIQDISAMSPLYECVVMNSNYTDLNFYYGGAAREIPEFNIRSYINPFSMSEAGEGLFGEAIKNPGYSNSTNDSFLDSKTLFNSVVVGLMVIMLLLLVVSIKKYKVVETTDE